ncbi:hypothetical protein ABZ767_32240, partial [Streptomyces pseudogriseolus]|uniref:hypothetical protein n=1 Tax=Streptomyces pseudogriseolus TaxID=36817 RepID=UPI00346FA4DF
VRTLIDDAERAVARGVFFPVLAAAPAAPGARTTARVTHPPNPLHTRPERPWRRRPPTSATWREQ